MALAAIQMAQRLNPQTKKIVSDRTLFSNIAFLFICTHTYIIYIHAHLGENSLIVSTMSKNDLSNKEKHQQMCFVLFLSLVN